VSKDVLARERAVSEAVALAMAEGALAASRGHLAAAITGYADAAPGSDQQAGLVHFAVAGPGAPTRHRCERFGDIGRARVRIACLRTSLTMLRERIALAPRPVLAY
jgi:nicotinamide-nucleotide amidase